MLILTEATPNPEAMKFVPQATLAEEGAWCFERDGFDPAASSLAAALFEIPGVARVFIAPQFVTVTREAEEPSWRELRYPILAALAEHIESGAPAVAEASEPVEDDGAVEAEIRQVLADYVRPGVARDGGDILFDHFDRDAGVLWIRMRGACGGCPSARSTLKAGVEQIVRRYVPEVRRVEELAAEPAQEEAVPWWKRWAGARSAPDQPAPRTVFRHEGRDIRRAGGEREPS